MPGSSPSAARRRIRSVPRDVRDGLVPTAPGGRVLGPGDAVGHELRDPLDGPEMVELDVFERHRDPELALQVQQEIDEHHRIERGGLEQIRVHGRHVQLQLVPEDLTDPGFQRARFGHRGCPLRSDAERPDRRRSYGWPSSVGWCYPTPPAGAPWPANASVTWRRSILPLAFRGSRSRTRQRAGSM